MKGRRERGALVPDFPIEEIIAAHQSAPSHAYERVTGLYERSSSRVVDPCGGLKRLPDYAARAALAVPPPPTEGSPELTGELLELYWAAALRDMPFSAYPAHPSCRSATAELHAAGVTRTNAPGDLFLHGVGRGDPSDGYVSQFLLAPVLEWPVLREQKYPAYEPGQDFMATEAAWTEAQSGEVSPGRAVHLRDRADYVRTGRRLATLVYQDHPSQIFVSACLQLHQVRDRIWPRRGPFRQQTRNVPFVMGGLPDLLALVGRCCQVALDCCWLLKWGRFAYPRPEEIAYWVSTSTPGDPLHATRQALARSSAPSALAVRERGLLSQAYPDGAPAHPSYPAGHAVVAGAAVTIIKAFVREDATLPVDFAPREATDADKPRGAAVGHELDKLAWNVAFGRCFAGVHLRSDCTSGLLLGEQIALGFLQQAKDDYPFPYTFHITLMDGTQATV